MKLGKKPFYEPQGRIFVIADVHGERGKLDNVLKKIRAILKKEDHVVFIGDLCDVGGDTPGVLKLVQEFKNFHKNTFVIFGNHEEMMLAAIRGNPGGWFENQGMKTLAQFTGYNDRPEDLNLWLKDNGITIFKDLIPYYETEKVLITHAPLPNKLGEFLAIEEGVVENLAERIRWNFVDHEKVKVTGVDKILICGHQNKLMTRHRVLEPRIYLTVNRIFIDAGAGYEKKAPLCCLVVGILGEIDIIKDVG